MRKRTWRALSIAFASLFAIALFVLSTPVKAEMQEIVATVSQVLTINIPTALNFNIDIIDEQWHEIPFQVGISSNNRTGYTFVSDVASQMANSKYSKYIKIDEKWTIEYPTGSVKETTTHAVYPNSDNSALDKQYNFKLKVLADSNVTNGTYTGSMTFFATANPYPNTIAYIEYLDQISNEIVLTMSPGKYYQLKDRRDGKKYWIVFENGELKMAQNLDYDISSSTALNNNYTSIKGALFTFANSTITGGTLEDSWVESADTPQSYDEGIIYRPSEEDAYTTINACTRDGYSEWECYRSAGGNYYNWTAAVASNDTSTLEEGYVAMDSICPKNWQLPTVSSDGYLALTMPEDKAAAGRIRCEGIKPGHVINFIVDDYYGHSQTKQKNNTAWGITSIILPKNFEYQVDNVHELAGWSLQPNNINPDYIKGGLFETDQAEVNLYAVWRDKPLKLDDITYMQEVTKTIISNTPNFAEKQLIDARDNKKYWVFKFGENLVMTQNLDYDMPSSSSYSRLTTDVIGDYYFSKTSSGLDFDGGNYYFANGTTKTPIEDFAEDDERWHYHIGNYYSPYNAKLGNYSTDWRSNTNYSICPKGWGIPTAKEFQNLRYNMSEYSRSKLRLVKGGYLTSRDIVTNEGTTSRYMANDFAYYDSYNAFYYSSDFESSSSSTSASNTYYAYNIRCIARKDYNVNEPSTSRLEQRQDSHSSD